MANFSKQTPANSDSLRGRMTLGIEDVEIYMTEDGKIFLKSAVIYTGDGYAAMAGVLKVQNDIELPASAFVIDDDYAGLCGRCNVAMDRKDASEGRYCYSCNCDLANAQAA